MIMVAIALVSTVDFQVCHDVDSRALICCDCCDLSWTSLLLAFVAWLRLRVIWIFSGTLDKSPYLFYFRIVFNMPKYIDWQFSWIFSYFI